LKKNRYVQIIEAIFFKYYSEGNTRVPFHRSDIVEAANQLGIKLPKNIGDVIYSFRYRTDLPKTIIEKAPAGTEWVIRPAGKAQYMFEVAQAAIITPNSKLAETKILDATPGVIEKYALNDEQALLAKIRYNRLVDIFTGLTCYSLQNHLRTAVSQMGQVETDEIYIGIDKRGVHYVLPVQAKGGTDKLGVVQIEQDLAVCTTKFPNLICKPLAAQFMQNNVIAMFELEDTEDGIVIVSEKHYRLVPPDELSPEELKKYNRRSLN
jgi:hypothetical protein